jgi:hypothetical protein
MGKSTISMAIFNSYVKLPEGIIMGYVWNISSQTRQQDDKGSHLFANASTSIAVNTTQCRPLDCSSSNIAHVVALLFAVVSTSDPFQKVQELLSFNDYSASFRHDFGENLTIHCIYI